MLGGRRAELRHEEGGKYTGALSEFKSGQDPGPEGPLARLITVIERVARVGWPSAAQPVPLGHGPRTAEADLVTGARLPRARARRGRRAAQAGGHLP